MGAPNRKNSWAAWQMAHVASVFGKVAPALRDGDESRSVRAAQELLGPFAPQGLTYPLHCIEIDRQVRPGILNALDSENHKLGGNIGAMGSPRDLFLTACAEIAESLSPLGFKFAKSGPHTQRKDSDFTYRVAFQSSHKNVAGQYVALWIHATVWSKRLAEWRASQPNALGVGDGVAGGQIGNLVRPHGWRDWNLAAPKPAAVIADAISTVQSIALPYFQRLADIPSVCALLQREEFPGMDAARAIEFLLCFADRPAADSALSAFFRARPDLLASYRTHLQVFRESGLPKARRTGFAYELAFVTVAYGLTPPNPA